MRNTPTNTGWITGKYGSVWQRDAWALLPLVLYNIKIADETQNPELQEWAKQVDTLLKVLHEGVNQGPPETLRLDIMEVALEHQLITAEHFTRFRARQAQIPTPNS